MAHCLGDTNSNSGRRHRIGGACIWLHIQNDLSWDLDVFATAQRAACFYPDNTTVTSAHIHAQKSSIDWRNTYCSHLGLYCRPQSQAPLAIQSKLSMYAHN